MPFVLNAGTNTYSVEATAVVCEVSDQDNPQTEIVPISFNLITSMSISQAVTELELHPELALEVITDDMLNDLYESDISVHTLTVTSILLDSTDTFTFEPQLTEKTVNSN